MARITVEDCIDDVANRFELVLLTAKRVRSLTRGEDLLVPRDNDKNTVVALREIAEGKVSPQVLREEIIKGSAARKPFADFHEAESGRLEPAAENIFAFQDVMDEERQDKVAS